jgi:succinate-semialdehyde dehydrogenase/glutarate-semialdehyde dehydrogenase
MTIASIDPHSGNTLRTFPPLDQAGVDRALNRAQSAFSAGRARPIAERAGWLRRASELLIAEKDRHARTMAQEMGKVLKGGVAEIEKCAWVCRFYADHAEEFLADEPIAIEGRTSFVRCLPLGPVLAIMPWNFPFWQVFRFAAPAIMAGNVGLLKHASNVPQCALAIEDLLLRAGVPAGGFQTLLVESRGVASIIADERVKAVTLTGSDEAGARVAEEAGRRLKKVVLELGGSDPFVVMPSADLDAAIRTAALARTINTGQSCIAAKRFIVHRDVYARFERGLVAALAALRVGDPSAPESDLGPLATAEILEGIERQVGASVAAGAQLLTGGKRLEVGPGGGWYYAPTALARIPPQAPVYHQEVFGPVALLFEARDLDHAILLANDSPYGLGSSVWTREVGERQRFIDEIEAGQTFVNGMVASDPRLPFGGVKRSGYGRELGREGIREFVNVKTVVIEER